MRIRSFTWVVAVLLAACTQGEDEVCQSDRDCDDGLVCTIEDDDRGFCQKPEDVEESPGDQDAAEPDIEDPDGSVDAGRDASVDPDMDAG